MNVWELFWWCISVLWFIFQLFLLGWIEFFPHWLPATVGAFIIFKNGGRVPTKKEAAVGEIENRLRYNCVSPPPMTSAEWGISWAPEKGPITQSPQERSRSGVKLEVFGERFEGEGHGNASKWTSERWGRGVSDTEPNPPPQLASALHAFPRRACGEKMSRCGMRESGEGVMGSIDEEERNILYSFPTA